ncbi:MAG: HAD hydrolase-like protein [Prevotella sp.]|nr:HAD hydrolase-like protein [Prevotella sp.]
MKKLNLEKIRALVFDADDTLWDCQSHFEQVEKQLYGLIAPYCLDPAAELYRTESSNMEDLGYGCKAFTISVVETALRVCGPDLTAEQLTSLLEAGKGLLHLPATPLPGVVETLDFLNEELRVKNEELKMVCFTKGELQDQENKLRRSGLAKYFEHVEITSNKTEHEFRQLAEHLGIRPDEMLMVGNSLKSDIAPAVAVGALAVHIPFHVTWQLEVHEDFEHENMVKIEQFSQLPEVLGLTI